MIEIWRDVVGWERYYQVSHRGRVRSKGRSIFVRHPTGGRKWRRYKGRALKACANPKSRYLMVSFSAPKRKRAYVYVHDLVLAAFHGPKPIGLEACHNDGNRANNDWTNLRYDTRSANARDRWRHARERRAAA